MLVTFSCIGLVTGLLAGLAPATLHAQTRPQPAAPDEDKARARVLFERAETLKHSAGARAQAGDAAGARAAYGEAAEMYMRAFKRFPHAAFVYNAAQMYRLSGQSAKAIAGYERYVALDPEGDRVADARARIAELRRERAARPGAGSNPREDAGEGAGASAEGEAADEGEDEAEDELDGEEEEPEDESGDESGDESEAGATGGADGELAPEPAGGAGDFDAEDEREDTGRGLRIGGLGAAAAGVIGLGIGVAYGLQARSISDELSGPRFMWTLEDRERFAEGERAERNALILVGLGGAALVTGGVLYLVGKNRDGSEVESDDRDRLGFSAAPTSDGASVLLWGRF